MLKYVFWFVLVGLTTALSFDFTRNFAIPFAFVLCMLYIRWMNGGLVAITKFTATRFDSVTDAINKNVKAINDHTNALKKLLLMEKDFPEIERQIDRVEKETHRNKDMLNKRGK